MPDHPRQNPPGRLPRRRLITGVGAAAGAAVLGGAVVSAGAAHAVPAGVVYEPGFSGPSQISDDGTVTITGSGFGVKPNGAKPLWFWPFETNMDPHPVYSRKTVNAAATGLTAEISTAINPPGWPSGAARINLKVAGAVLFKRPGAAFSSNFLYVWTRRYYDFDFQGMQGCTPMPNCGFNLKTHRFWPGGTGQINNYIPGAYQAQNALDGNPRSAVEYAGGTQTAYWPNDGLIFEPRRWLIEEFEYRNNSAVDVNDGVGHYFRYGRHALPPSKRWTFRGSENPGYTDRTFTDLVFDQKSADTSLDEAHVYMDLLYVDDSWCRVIISNESSYQVVQAPGGSEVNREIQLPTAWSNTSITFNVKQRSHATLAGKYLYVIRNDGTPLKVARFT